MDRKFQGDSFDAVKRLWQEVFAEWAPLYAEPRFIPNELREDFFRLTRIPLLDAESSHHFSIFNDPDTGIRLSPSTQRSRSHLSMSEIVEQLHQRSPVCVLTYDQSFLRQPNRPLAAQRQEKLRLLSSLGATGFYYRSHAPLLFAFASPSRAQEAMSRLRDAGIPKGRIEELDSSIEASGGTPTV